MAGHINDLYTDFSVADTTKFGIRSGSPTFSAATGLTLPTASTISEVNTDLFTYTYPLNATNRSVFIRTDQVSTEVTAESRFRIQGTATPDTAGNQSTIDIGFVNGSLRCRYTNSAGTASDTNLVITGTLLASMKWWRIRHSSATGYVYWETSPDGFAWTTRRSVLYSTLVTAGINLTQSRVILSAFKTVSSATSFIVRYFNTTRMVNYAGSAWVEENWKGFDPTTYTVTANNVIGSWQVVTGSPTFTQSLATNNDSYFAKNLSVSTGLYIKALTPGKSDIKDVDITFRCKSSASSITWIKWRDLGTTQSSYLKVDAASNRLQLYKVEASTHTLIQNYAITISSSLWYEYRVVHVGNTAVVYRDGVELFRSTSATTTPATTEGPLSINGEVAGALVTDIRMTRGTLPLSTTSFSMEAPQSIPASYISTSTRHQFEYIYFKDDTGARFTVMPSPGAVWLDDLDMGSASSRQVINNRPLGDGARDYTKYSGPKSVTMSAFVLPDTYGTIMQYTDALSSWSLPGRRITMVFKPQGQPERFINLTGSEFQAPIAAVNKQFNKVTLQWVAPDGGSYSTAWNYLQLTTANKAYVLRNGGSARSEPILRMVPGMSVINESYEATHPGEFARLALSNTPAFTVTVAGSEFVDLNTRERSVLYRGFGDESANRRPMLTSSFWFPLDPGNSILTCTGTTGIVEVLWQDKFII